MTTPNTQREAMAKDVGDRIEQEVQKYLDMKERQGYGHTIEDVRKHVNAGVIIHKHFASSPAPLDVKDVMILYDALREAKRTIKSLHGDIAWDIYDQHSPEMKRINKAIKLFESSDLKSISSGRENKK